MKEITLRVLRPEEGSAVVRLSRAVYGEHHEGAEEWRHALRVAGTVEGKHSPYLALAGTEPAGYGCLRAEPWMYRSRKRRLELLVHPDRRERGIGRRLYGRLLDDARRLELAGLEARVREDRFECLAFLDRRGFRERERTWDLVLDLPRADLDALPEALERLARDGIRVCTLAEERERVPDAARRLHELWNLLGADQPGYTAGTAPPLAAFAEWLESPATLPEACLIARDGEEYVGVTMLRRRTPGERWLSQNVTGTRRGYRRRGIATALKLLSIDWARRAGYDQIVTRNESSNVAMLELNRRLGFRLRSGWVRLELEGLAAEARRAA